MVRGGSNWNGQAGQASVELVAVAAALAVVGLVGWQLVVAANVWQTVQSAAGIAARAGQVGAPVKQAALAALPDRLATRATINTVTGSDGSVRIRVRVPIPVVVGSGSWGYVDGESKVVE